MMKKIVLITAYFLLLTSVNAQSVDLLWQGSTYTSPFYKGRSLWSNQSNITLVAIPQGLGSAPSLNYKWTKNGTVLGNVSGVGRNTLTFSDSILSKPQTVKIEVISGAGNVLAQYSTVITPVPGNVYVYENNPLLGFLFHRETSGTYPLKEKEVTFTAFPFFFSVLNRTDPHLSYKWGSDTGGSEDASSVTYRTPEEGSGTSAISLNLSNTEKIMQSAKKNFLVQFGNDE